MSYKYRQSDLRHPIDRKEHSTPIVGQIINSAQLMDSIPTTPAEQIASVRRHILQRMRNVEDGKLLAAVLGVRWRDIGDWPDDRSIDTDPE